MSKKAKKHSPSIDMTAMVDVAFLLLTFFILTTTHFREDSKVEVDTPSSVANFQGFQGDLCTISVAADGRIFVGYSSPLTREKVLKQFITENDIKISKEGANYFSTLQEFGVPHIEIDKWLNLEGDRLKGFEHVGISSQITDRATLIGNELKDWIRWGRLSDQQMRFAIKGDVNADYPAISKVINSLQEWNVNRFSLITELENGDDIDLLQEISNNKEL